MKISELINKIRINNFSVVINIYRLYYEQVSLFGEFIDSKKYFYHITIESQYNDFLFVDLIEFQKIIELFSSFNLNPVRIFISENKLNFLIDNELIINDLEVEEFKIKIINGKAENFEIEIIDYFGNVIDNKKVTDIEILRSFSELNEEMIYKLLIFNYFNRNK